MCKSAANGGDIMLRGPNNPVWTVLTDSGQRLSLDEFKNSLQMPLTERDREMCYFDPEREREREREMFP